MSDDSVDSTVRARLRGLMATLDGPKSEELLLLLDWEGIYELLDGFRLIGPDAAVAGPSLLRLYAELQREVLKGRSRWAPVVDAAAQVIGGLGPLQLSVDGDPFESPPALWPGPSVTFRPRNLAPPTDPPHSEDYEGPATTNGRANRYLDDEEGFEAMVAAASALGMQLTECRYAAFMHYAVDPRTDGYLAQLELLTEPVLRAALGDESLWAFPEQEANILMALEGFVQSQSWSANELARSLRSDDEEPFDPDEWPALGFGLRVEERGGGQVCRIWSRGWIEWRPQGPRR